MKINIESILHPIFKENKSFMLFYKIAQGWESFIEPSFVHITRPLKLETAKEKSVLFVAVPNTSVSSQFYYSKAKILSSICLYLGYEAISDIKTVLGEFDNGERNSSNISIKEVELEEKFTKLIANIRGHFFN